MSAWCHRRRLLTSEVQILSLFHPTNKARALTDITKRQQKTQNLMPTAIKISMMDGRNERSPQDTAVFNVGGKHYQVSLSLIEQYPESMFPRLISWNDDFSMPIFVDRDGDIFAHVLNYMRYRSIELPHSLPRAMFNRELDFYGVLVEDGCIQQSTSIGTMKQIKQTIHDAELQHDMLLIASHCHNQFMSGRSTVNIRSDLIDLKHSPYFYDEDAAIMCLNDYLEKFFNLEAFQQEQLYATDLDFVLKVRELTSEVQEGADEDTTETTPPPLFNDERLSEFDPFRQVEQERLVIPDEASFASSTGGTPLHVTPVRRRDRNENVLNTNEFLMALDHAFMTP